MHAYILIKRRSLVFSDIRKSNWHMKTISSSVKLNNDFRFGHFTMEKYEYKLFELKPESC